MASFLCQHARGEELRDLLAYLVSGGNQNSKVFKAPASAEGDR